MSCSGSYPKIPKYPDSVLQAILNWGPCILVLGPLAPPRPRFGGARSGLDLQHCSGSLLLWGLLRDRSSYKYDGPISDTSHGNQHVIENYFLAPTYYPEVARQF